MNELKKIIVSCILVLCVLLIGLILELELLTDHKPKNLKQKLEILKTEVTDSVPHIYCLDGMRWVIRNELAAWPLNEKCVKEDSVVEWELD